MQLSGPFQISSRLMPAVHIGGAWLSLDHGRTDREGREVYDVWIDLPDGSEHQITDLRSGVGGGSIVEGMSALLSFLGAAAESRQYRERMRRSAIDPEGNEGLFVPAVVDWACQYSDELACLSCEIEESGSEFVQE